MIFEHEIPSGSKLYFGDSAKLKRDIEYRASNLLYKEGFEEIVTPVFSYHQHDSFENQNPLIRLNDSNNHTVTLRADSTPDVVRIATKRLGRSMESKKWFYIQPVYLYPTKEQYQIGGEIIEGNFGDSLEVTLKLLKTLDINPMLQIANICIPKLLSQKYGISLDILKSMQIETILKSEYKWIESLVTISTKDDLNDLSIYPDDIKEELVKIKKEAEKINYSNLIISPLFYAKMRYYDSLTFKMFIGNELLAMGGEYSIEELKAAGFAIYLDECIRLKSIDKEEKN
ncbi:ATP phosphoribosyltransferase regulatory subunit [Sulfurovum sp. enrichment culture clone C5]|uniref:ATP phosphoribosyltransferase regulatory subunit n=1 Tax=Sulfurovum sp. enrichment culture clone C5 TaxID=497650 RepID=A0A0S4XLC4_9BACT|nr:ATP phosphoribosyltransferase regulatory subunit [Sulfurovum sp. enrichment culture clone C5]